MEKITIQGYKSFNVETLTDEQLKDYIKRFHRGDTSVRISLQNHFFRQVMRISYRYTRKFYHQREDIIEQAFLSLAEIIESIPTRELDSEIRS